MLGVVALLLVSCCCFLGYRFVNTDTDPKSGSSPLSTTGGSGRTLAPTTAASVSPEQYQAVLKQADDTIAPAYQALAKATSKSAAVSAATQFDTAVGSAITLLQATATPARRRLART
ncbi:hypothetical protein ACFQX7_11985 [Luedemannella flava]